MCLSRPGGGVGVGPKQGRGGELGRERRGWARESQCVGFPVPVGRVPLLDSFCDSHVGRPGEFRDSRFRVGQPRDHNPCLREDEGGGV
jgi:hypothetical protein